MSNASTQAAAPRRTRRRLWPWLLGALGVVVALGVAALIVLVHRLPPLVFELISGLGGASLAEACDPEKQWPRLRAILPYDARPQDYMVLSLGDACLLVKMDEGDFPLHAILFHAKEGEAAHARDLAHVAIGDPHDGSPSDVTAMFVDVQGLALPAVRFHRDAPGPRHAIRLRLTDESAPRQTIVEIACPDGRLVADDEVRAFLAPFRIEQIRRRRPGRRPRPAHRTAVTPSRVTRGVQ